MHMRMISLKNDRFIHTALHLQKIMNRTATIVPVRQLMLEYGMLTGLDPVGVQPRRYLWTDAFAVCNYLALFSGTNDDMYRQLALRLIDQVHHTLGQHRTDDPRNGWISGLSSQEGELHPTIGGLRIGKLQRERGPNEYYNVEQEWDQDGQYYHYLTKWMHALSRMGHVAGSPVYARWAIELAHTAHARFTYLQKNQSRKNMYWKMSIDLTRPLVFSMGQHDPLDGLVTYNELQLAATRDFGQSLQPDLTQEIADMTDICRGIRLFTDDPLGIGGLLSDASRIIQLIIQGGMQYSDLLDSVLDSAQEGAAFFTECGSLELPATHRLPFRELGLSIGLSGVRKMPDWIRNNPGLFDRAGPLQRTIKILLDYMPFKEKIEEFWLDKKNRESGTWTGHRDINMVMLATSLAPEGFLEI